MSTIGKLLRKITYGNIFKGDNGIWMVYFFLCMISLVEVYSASSRLTFKGGEHWDPMISQAEFLLFGLSVILVTIHIGCRWFMTFPFILLPASIVMLMCTSVFGMGSELNGTHRWIQIGSFSFQPSELAKASLIIYTALILAKTQAEKIKLVNGTKVKTIGAFKYKNSLAYWLIAVPTIIICGLIFMDNISTSVMLGFVIFVMMCVGHVPKRYLFKSLGAIAILVAVIGSIAMVMPDEALNSNSMTKRLTTVKHRMNRMTGRDTVDDSKRVMKSDKQKMLDDKNSQKTYAFIAIANSNVIGRGPGNSIQRDFLQHAESDFIYAIIIEELGIFGMLFVPFLYFVLLIRCVRIAQRCDKFFPAFLVIGCALMIVLQAFVNMAVAVVPHLVTGQPLPLISKGGTSIMFTSFYFGMILSVSRYVKKKEENAPMVEAATNGETSEYYNDKGLV